MAHDTVTIREISLPTRIGIAAEERADLQTLSATVEIEVDTHDAARTDDLAATIDYATVAASIRAIALERERNLLETLAEEIAAHVLQLDGAHAVSVELRKFILPGTRHVAVRIRRP
jgi:FolB domain-containing protein